MPRLIVYAGPNGSGKSTIRDIAHDPVDVEIDPDRIRRTLTAPGAGDIEAGREAIRRFRAAIEAKKTRSLETTLTGSSVLARIASARAAGYDVSLYYVALRSAEENVARVAARVAKGGHAIPEDTIRRRVAASHDNLGMALLAVDHAQVYDNSGPVLVHLLTVERGRIVFEAAEPPEWLRVRLPQIRERLRTGAG